MTDRCFSRVSDYAGWHASNAPHAPALVLEDRVVDYATLSQCVDALARALLAAGVQKGDRVATLQAPNPEYFVAFLATASIGGIWVGLNPRYRIEELSFVVKDAAPRILLARSRIGDRDYSEEISALRAASPSLMQTVVFDGDPPVDDTMSMAALLAQGSIISDAQLASARERCGQRDACLLVYTSGSTGKPKGALLHHAGIIRFSLEQNRLWPVMPLSMVNYFPINHIGCMVDCSMPVLAAGGTMYFMEQFDARGCLDLMDRQRVTLWGSVPSVFQMQLARPDFAEFDLSAVQLIVWGGAAMPAETLSRLAALGPSMATNYGMTEATSAITVVEPTHDLDVLGNSVGTAFPGVEIKLADPVTGEVVAQGSEGEILVRSDLNFLGYWNNPEATVSSFTTDGFFHTGDLAVQRNDGRYRIVGRIKEMFKSGGYNVYPREIETVLESHPAVAQAAVVPVADPVWQEVAIAYLSLRTPVSVAEIENYCRSRLANYKVPKRFFIRDALPLLPIGKIDKRALKAMASAEA